MIYQQDSNCLTDLQILHINSVFVQLSSLFAALYVNVQPFSCSTRLPLCHVCSQSVFYAPCFLFSFPQECKPLRNTALLFPVNDVGYPDVKAYSTASLCFNSAVHRFQKINICWHTWNRNRRTSERDIHI